jgi:hypothetical protein
MFPKMAEICPNSLGNSDDQFFDNLLLIEGRIPELPYSRQFEYSVACPW